MKSDFEELRMEHISKRFGAVQALRDVTFAAKPGTVHALCGENGAGKSTLMKILAGVHREDGGKILLNGKEVTFATPKAALNAGISMLYQELDLADELTVFENIFLGREICRKGFPMLDDAKMIETVRELFSRYHFQISPTAKVSSLSMGEAQLVELAKALLRQARIIVMDEPTSSLSEGESRTLFEIIRTLKAEGMAIIYISHRLEEIMTLADEISVLRDGEIVFHTEAAKTSISEIVRHMVGRELHDFYPARNVKIGEEFFRAEKLTNEKIHQISFSVRKGEIVGMAGLVGAGRTETADAIFGCDKLRSGEIYLNGKKQTIRRPQDAIDAGIAYLTEDRKRNGLWQNLPCAWNITMPNLGKLNMSLLIDQLRETKLCEENGRRVNVKWSSPNAPASSLSGGNQQKLLIARWLMANSDFIIFDEPTRGIDIGAKKEVYLLLNELAAQGKAILVISSELPELLGICDRILVMRDGSVRGELSAAEATQEIIMRLAATSNQ
ncbi:MAG: sugar ABC transporter ATP-binding protein [Lentisphaeria bacterium]|nr:sugar ABC transporter ATP-binding protein [Lentisphaeria bacterium]